jgi:hypothetical protein
VSGPAFRRYLQKPDVTRTTVRISPNPVALAKRVTISVTVTDTSTPATIVQGRVAFTDKLRILHLGGASVAVVFLGEGQRCSGLYTRKLNLGRW